MIPSEYGRQPQMPRMLPPVGQSEGVQPPRYAGQLLHDDARGRAGGFCNQELSQTTEELQEICYP